MERIPISNTVTLLKLQKTDLPGIKLDEIYDRERDDRSSTYFKIRMDLIRRLVNLREDPLRRDNVVSELGLAFKSLKSVAEKTGERKVSFGVSCYDHEKEDYDQAVTILSDHLRQLGYTALVNENTLEHNENDVVRWGISHLPRNSFVIEVDLGPKSGDSWQP